MSSKQPRRTRRTLKGGSIYNNKPARPQYPISVFGSGLATQAGMDGADRHQIAPLKDYTDLTNQGARKITGWYKW